MMLVILYHYSVSALSNFFLDLASTIIFGSELSMKHNHVLLYVGSRIRKTQRLDPWGMLLAESTTWNLSDLN
jgi:hypothetical protein